MNGTIQKKKDSLSDFQGLLFVFECVVVISQDIYPKQAGSYERLLSWKDTKGLTIRLSLVRAKSNEFALLPGHVVYREPGGHEIGGQKSHLFSWSNTQIKIVEYHSWVNTYIENSNDSNFFLYLAPDSSPKGPHPYGVIQPKRYMGESFCIETIPP